MTFLSWFFYRTPVTATPQYTIRGLIKEYPSFVELNSLYFTKTCPSQSNCVLIRSPLEL